jgi:hypothetical protein
MRSIVSGIVFWGVAVFFLAGVNTVCLGEQSSGIQLPDHSMFEDNLPFDANDQMGAFRSGNDGSVTVGQDLVVGPDEVVDEAVVMGADLTVYGTVNGDAVCIGGNLTLGPGAVVKGDLVNVGGTLTVDPTAKTYKDRVNIGGGFPFNFLKGILTYEIQRPPDQERSDGPFGRIGGPRLNQKTGEKGFAARLLLFAMDFVYILLLLFFALLLTTFMPRQFGHIEAHLSNEFPRSVLLGIASMAGAPIVLVAFIISVIGILFIPFFLLALAVSLLMGYAVFSRMLGRKLLPGRQIILQIMGGLLLLHSPLIIGDLFLLPDVTYLSIIGYVFRGVGSVVFFCVNFIGLGAVFYSLWGKRAPVSAGGEPQGMPEDKSAIEGTEDAGVKDVEAEEVKDVEEAEAVEEGAERKGADEGTDDAESKGEK